MKILLFDHATSMPRFFLIPKILDFKFYAEILFEYLHFFFAIAGQNKIINIDGENRKCLTTPLTKQCMIRLTSTVTNSFDKSIKLSSQRLF